MKRRVQTRITRSPIDALESRRLLATFSGTPGDDTINIFVSGANTHVVINGADSITADTQITINAGDGNDAFMVASTRAGTFIHANGEQGNDSLMNPSLLDLDAVYLADFEFDGGTGVDTVVADNGHDSTTPANINIQFNRITKGFFSLEFSDVEELDYRDSDGSNRISFTNLNPDPLQLAHLSIHGNGGNDTITNTSGATNSAVWAASLGAEGAFIDGGAGTDTIVLDNTAGNDSPRFEMNATTIKLTSSSSLGPLVYSGCEAVDVRSNDLSDQVILNGKPSGTSLRYDGLDGNDSFEVGDGDLDSNGFLLSNTTLLGGPGTDRITIDDRFDDQSDGTTSTYTLSNPATFANTLAKGTFGLRYETFERPTLLVEDRFIIGFNTVPIVNVNATAAQITGTTIIGGANRQCIVNVTQGDLASLSGTLTVNFSGGAQDTLNINDQNAGGIVNGYQVTATKVLKTSTAQTINHSGVKKMTLNASSVFDAITIDGTPEGMALTVNGNGGNDIFTFGSGDISAQMFGPVVLNGGAGTDSLTISNSSDAALATQTLTATTFTDGLTHTYGGFETLAINEGPGGTNLIVNSVGIATTINGGAGDDAFTAGGGDIDANLLPGAAMALVIHGNAGNDFITFDDLNDTNVDAYIFQRLTTNIDQLDKRDTSIDYFINWSGVEGVTLEASNAPTPSGPMSGIVVNDIATSLRINGNAGNDWVQIFDAQAPITVNTGLGGTDRMDVNFDFDAQPLTVIVDQSDDIETLNVHAPAVLRVTDGAVLTKTRLASFPANPNINGVLDLFGGAFLSRAGGPTPMQFRNQIITGRNGGAWNGTGVGGAINSSLASLTPVGDGIGYGLGSDIAPTTIGPFSIAANDVLLRYTLDGDTDLNQQVKLDDFNRLASNFGLANRVWTDGDSTYDNSVNLTDFNALAGNFGQAIAPPRDTFTDIFEDVDDDPSHVSRELDL